MFKRSIFPALSYIVLLNLILKIGVFCYIAPWNKNVEEARIMNIADSKGYEYIATTLLRYHTYAPPVDTINVSHYSGANLKTYFSNHADAERMPGYPTFLAFVYQFFGIKPFVAIFIQILLSLISVAMVYRIAMLLFDNKNIASLSTLLFAIDIHSILEANKLLSDTLFVIFMITSVYYFIKGLQNGRLKDILISAIYMGIACLIRPVVLMYPFVLIIILFIFQKQKINHKIKSALAFILLVFCCTSIWSFRNYCKYDSWQLVTQSGNHFLLFNVASTQARLANMPIDSVRLQLMNKADSMGLKKEKNLFKQSNMFLKVSIDYILQHKMYYLFNNYEGGINMFFLIGLKGKLKINNALGWDDKKDWGKELILASLIVLFLMIQYGGCLYGTIRLIKARNYLPVVLFFLTALYFISITGVVGNIFERYKLPVLPFICIIAGYGYWQIINKFEFLKNVSK